MRMRYPFSQELSKVMNRDCNADRCDDQISFFSFQSEIRAIAAVFRREKYSGQLRDGITMELRDRVTGHGVFQCVLLSPVTLNRIL